MRNIKLLLLVVAGIFSVGFVKAQLAPSGITADFYVRTIPNSQFQNVTLTADVEYILEPLVSGFVCFNESVKWTIYGSGIYSIDNIYAKNPKISLKPGVYTVELWAGTSPANAFEFCGASYTSKKKTGWITVPFVTPVAKFKTNGNEIASTTIPLNGIVSFTDFSTNYPTSWLWTVAPSTGWAYTSGNSASQNAAIKFTTSGNYSVSLKATNPAGNMTVVKSSHVSVLAGPPTANFTVNQTEGSPVTAVQNVPVNFNDLSTNLPTAWTWAINPASGWSYSSGNANAQNPMVNFTTVGQYSISLIASNTGGTNTLNKINYLKIAPPAPVASGPVNYCKGAVSTALPATGTGLKWYNTASGGIATSYAPTPSTVNTGTFVYYVSQTVNNIEGPRTAINVIVNALPVVPAGNASVNYCVGSPAAALTASGTNLKWYTTSTGGTGSSTAPVPSTSAAGTTNYYVSQTNANGCESPRLLIAVKVAASLDAPVVISPVNYCLNGASEALTATGSNLKWYTVSSGGSSLASAPIPATNSAGTTNYYVSQSTPGCAESPRALLTVNINNGAAPVAPTVNSPVTLMQGTNATALTAGGTNLRWYATPTGGSFSSIAPVPSTISAGTTTHYVSQSNANCEGPRATINVMVTPTPGGTADWVWAKQVPFGLNSTTKFAIDSLGNSYVTGSFLNTLTIGTATITATGNDLFVAKFDPAGELVWLRKACAGGGNEFVQDIAVDASGNYYLCGGFLSGSTVFGAFTLNNSTSGRNAFIAKYDSSGSVKWAKQYNVPEFNLNEEAFSIAIDNNSNVAIGGFEELKSGSTTYRTGMINKYDSIGNLVFKSSVYGGINLNNNVQDISFDGLGNLIYTGRLNNTYFIEKVNPTGRIVWRRSTPTANTGANSLAADQNGNIYVLGYFATGITLNEYTLTAPGAMFIAKYDAAGQVVWAKKSTGNIETGNQLNIDRFGNSFITGSFRNTLGLDNIVINSSNTNGSDIFAAKFNTAGNAIWAQTVATSGYYDGHSIQVDKLGNSYVSGFFGATGNFGSINLSGPGKFLAKLGSAIPVLPEIYTGRLAEETYIAGDALPVQFTSTGSFDSSNVFTVQLSDASGSFDNTVVIGSGSSSPIRCIIPPATPAGTKYRLRVIATSPGIFGIDNGNNIVINSGNISPAPGWVWGKNFPTAFGPYAISKVAAVTDSVGNTFVTGHFRDSVISNTDTLVTSSNNSFDIFVARLNASGEVVWFRRASQGTGSEEVGGIAIDTLGNYYLTGQYSGTAVFGAVSLSNTTAYKDLFAVKYNKDGVVQWAKKYEGLGTKDDKGIAIVADPAGNNIYVGGTTDEFYNVTQTSASIWTGALIIKYNAAGVPVFTRTPSPYLITEYLTDIAVDNVGNVLVTGSRYNAGYYGFVYKFDNVGTQKWVKVATGSGGNEVSSITTDKKGNSYITGGINGQMNFSGLAVPLKYADFFLAKLDSAGTGIWIKTGGGPDIEAGASVVLDPFGAVYVTGNFQHTAVFDGISVTNSNSGASDVFAAKYDTSGNIVWVQKAGLNGQDAGQNIGVDNQGNSYVTGVYNGSINFGQSSLGPGPSLSFIAKIASDPLPGYMQFSPQSGDSGTVVTITGAGFVNVTNVSFNGTAASSFIVDSINKITAVVAPGTVTGQVEITSAIGTGRSGNNFTVVDSSGIVQLCPPVGSTALVSNLSGTIYQWQVNDGGGFVNISDGINFSGSSTKTLSLNGISSSLQGYQFRCVVNGANSRIFTVKFENFWTGAVNSDWENAGNWSCGMMPDETTTVNLNSDAVVKISSNVTIKTMNAKSGAIVTILPGYLLQVLGK